MGEFADFFSSAGGSFLSSAQQNYYNKKESSKARKFQALMSNTAHEREVKDLRKAGLNPVLSANYGGASTGSGSMATVGQGPNSALVAKQLDAMDANILKERSSADLNSAMSAYYDEQTFGAQEENKVRVIRRRQEEQRDIWRSGKKGQFWRNVLVPASDYLKHLNPFSAVGINQKVK